MPTCPARWASGGEPPCRADHLPRPPLHRAGRAPGRRGPLRQAGLRDVRGVARCSATRPAARRRRDLPVPGRYVPLVLHPADGHQAGRGPPNRSSASFDKVARAGSGGYAGISSARATASTPCRTAAGCPTIWTRRLVVLSTEYPCSKEEGNRGGRGQADPRNPGQHPAALPQYPRFPCRRQDATAGLDEATRISPGIPSWARR